VEIIIAKDGRRSIMETNKKNQEVHNMAEFVLKYWLQCLFGLICGGLSAGYLGLKSRMKRNKIIEEALLALLHDRLYAECQKNIMRGWATADDKRNIEYMYKPYKTLGGNGTCEAMYSVCLTLPFSPKEKDE